MCDRGLRPDSDCHSAEPTERRADGSSDRTDGSERAISPVIGTVLMVVLTVLLASTVVAVLTTFPAELDESKSSFDDAAQETATGNPWAGSLGELVQLSDSEAGATGVRVRINFTIQAGSDTIGNSLNSVKVDVQTGDPNMFGGTSQSDLEKAVVDTDGDGDGEEDVEERLVGWVTSNGGSTVKIEFADPVYTVQESDSVIIVFGNVDNPPSAGDYNVRIQTSGDGNWQNGQITVT